MLAYDHLRQWEERAVQFTEGVISAPSRSGGYDRSEGLNLAVGYS
jgi:hypothetical protein